LGGKGRLLIPEEVFTTSLNNQGYIFGPEVSARLLRVNTEIAVIRENVLG